MMCVCVIGWPADCGCMFIRVCGCVSAIVDHQVLEARFEEPRLEKERAAILSEMSMVNTMDYRVECQILSALHAENKLALRFPIGKEELIRSWTLEDVKVRAWRLHTPHHATPHPNTLT